jgi:hypothetical protein
VRGPASNSPSAVRAGVSKTLCRSIPADQSTTAHPPSMSGTPRFKHTGPHNCLRVFSPAL